MRFVNLWDDTKAVTGSVYLNPTYSSGVESGLAMRTAPATLHFTAGQGAPARHMNFALFGTNDNWIKAAQHKGMQFASGRDWFTSTLTNITCIGVARSNRGFIVANDLSVKVLREPRQTDASTIMLAAVVPLVVHDDGFYIADFEVGSDFFASSSTVSGTAFSGTAVPLAAASIAANSMLVSTNAGAIVAFTYSGTGLLPTSSTVTVPSGTYTVATTASWGTAQPFVGASTATGNVIFYARGAKNEYLVSTDCVTLSKGAFTGVTHDRIMDVAYDVDQGAYVLAAFSSTGSTVAFYTNPSSTGTWTLSATATGPSWLSLSSADPCGFTICSSVWFMVTAKAPPNAVFGVSGDALARAFGVYSLDYGKTWFPADLEMANLDQTSDGIKLKVVSSVDQILVASACDVAISGRLGLPENV